MLDDAELEQEVRVLMYEIMMLLYNHGITEVHVGGLMRLLGIENKSAGKHDNEVIVIDEKFVKYVEQIYQSRPPDQILH